MVLVWYAFKTQAIEHTSKSVFNRTLEHRVMLSTVECTGFHGDHYFSNLNDSSYLQEKEQNNSTSPSAPFSRSETIKDACYDRDG